MENPTTPEAKPSLLNRMTSLIQEKKREIVEKFGKSDWKTEKEMLDAHKIYIAGTTVAIGLAALAAHPGMDNFTGYTLRSLGGTLGLAAAASEGWAMFKLWNVGEKQKMQAKTG